MKSAIAILTLWRDSEPYIHNSLNQFAQLEKVLSDHYEIYYSFYENDSSDNTASILKNWLDQRNGILINENLFAPKWGSVPSLKRTMTLASYRNKCLNSISNIKYDYLFVVDSDICYSPNLLQVMLFKMDKYPLLGMITANTVQNVKDVFHNQNLCSYYDSWALIDINGNPGLSFSSNPFLVNHDRLLWEAKKPVIVNSAFGGAALIRGALMRDNQLFWQGDTGCEHWHLCRSIRSLNYFVVVDPLLKAEITHRKIVTPDFILVNFDKTRLKLSYLGNRSLKYATLNIILRLNLAFLYLLLKIKRFLSSKAIFQRARNILQR